MFLGIISPVRFLFLTLVGSSLGASPQQVGIGKDEEMRIVLDSDEERFGGHCRMEEGHGQLPKGGPTHNRPSCTAVGCCWLFDAFWFWRCYYVMVGVVLFVTLRI